jgi:aminoglycoside 6'-N-acetyltransferase
MVLRPLCADDASELLRIHRTPEVARWWGEPEHGFPLADDPDATRQTIVIDGRIAGMIEFSEELTPRYRHASVDVFLDPAFHARGHGTEAVARVVRELLEEQGHHRVTIDPAVDNAAAIRAYEKVGFRPVGVMRAYERDNRGEGWHDALLMELLVGEQLPVGDEQRGTGDERLPTDAEHARSETAQRDPLADA